MSEANRTKFSIVEEPSIGGKPASPVFEELRITSVALAYALKTVESAELRSDRQISDFPRVGFDANGNVPVEMSYGNLDHLLRGLFFNEWDVTPVRDNNFQAGRITNVAVTTNVFTVVTSGTDYRANTGSFAVGHIVRASGFTAAGNNGLRRCTTASATVPVLAPFSGGATVSVADASPVTAARLKVVGFAGAAVSEMTVTAPGGGIGTITRASGTVDFTTLGIQGGDWIKISGFATSAVNDWVRVSSTTAITASVITLDRIPSGWVADTGTGVTPVFYLCDQLRNGTTKRSYLGEIQYQDLAAPEFEYYRGLIPAELSMNIEADSIVTAQMGFTGFEALGPYTTRGGPSAEAYTSAATDRAAPTNDVMNASSNVGGIYEGGSKLASPNFVLSASLTINNGLRPIRAVGSLPNVNVNAGTVKVTGELTCYYGSNAVLTKIRNSTASSFDVPLIDPSGTKAIIIDVPRLKYTDGNPQIPGRDTDRTLPSQFGGMRHPQHGFTVSYSRCEEFA